MLVTSVLSLQSPSLVSSSDRFSSVTTFDTLDDRLVLSSKLGATSALKPNAAALAAATTVFSAVGAGQVLIIYSGSATDHSRIAVSTLDASGDVTSAVDVAILVGVTVVEASTGLASTNFILD